MRTNIASMIGVLCCLAGCGATKAPYQAKWYMVEGEGSPPAMKMYVVVLNQSAQTRTIRNIILNRIAAKDDSGWRLFGKDINRPLAPGKVILAPIPESGHDNEAWQCRIPIEVIVVDEDGKPVPADLAIILPNAMPETWSEEMCKK